MLPHQQRVVDEKNELDDKRTKLSSFFINRIYLTLPHDEQARLHLQYVFMTEYSNILGQRIDNF